MADEEKTEILPPEEFDREVDTFFEKAKKARKKKNIAILIACLAVVVAAIGAGIALEVRDENQGLATQVNENADKLDETNRKLSEQRKQFEDCKTLPKTDPRCKTPVAPPTPTATPVRPSEDPPEPQGIGAEEVRNIVAGEVARRNFNLTPQQMATVTSAVRRTIPTPKDGKDGRTPTTAELQGYAQAAVATFCANGACRGEDGADGNDGTDGTDGQDAPPPTEEQLVAAVTVFCSQESLPCKGDKGDTGATGAAGANGKNLVVETTNYVEDDKVVGKQVTFRYEDGTGATSFVVRNGTDGRDAFPFTFSFSVPGTLPTDPARTYTCTITNPATPVSCELQPN